MLSPPLPLQAFTPEALTQRVDGLSLAEARKIVSAVHHDRGLDAPVRGVRRSSLEAVRAAGSLPSLERRTIERSALDPFLKLLLATADGHLLETVRIPLERRGRFSVCVSSQVGCALACTFCATGRLGLTRNLETWEMVEQVRLVRSTLTLDFPSAGADGMVTPPEERARVHGVVFQGMGEPLANLDRVLETIAVLTEPSALSVDARAITVCTAGIPSGIRRLGSEAPKVRLGLSIGSARPPVRRSLMPIDRAHSLDEVLEAAEEHARMTGLAPMWAVTLLAGVNDSDEDAVALAARAHAFAERTGVRPRLTVIPYNVIADGEADPFRRTDAARETGFRLALRTAGIATHKRYSGGADVRAACGQLAATESATLSAAKAGQRSAET